MAEVEPVEEKPARVSAPPPRFSLQLLRAGDCALLVELPTGQPFQSRDPAYILLKDLLRAAGLPDSPQLLGEPVRWPLLSGWRAVHLNLPRRPATSPGILPRRLATP